MIETYTRTMTHSNITKIQVALLEHRYGQSSGGSLVLALATSPLAGQLFQNGISMSGSPKLTATPIEAAAQYYSEFIENTPCHDATNVSNCLHDLPAQQVQKAMPKDWDSASFSFTAFAKNFTYVVFERTCRSMA